jgi:imidazolonepropionase-like amidohydrolase
VRFRVFLLILLCGSTTSNMAVRRVVAQHTPATVAITGATIVDVNATDESSARRAAQIVLIERGEIARVRPAATVHIPRVARRVDGRDRYLIPGLWDAHAHVSQGAGTSALAAYVANGITTVRDLGGRISDNILWQQQIRTGAIIGPRFQSWPKP